MATGASGVYNAVGGLADGDYARAGVGVADAAASASLFTPAAPVGATWLGARAAHDVLRAGVDHFGLGDAIGRTINKLGQRTGLWGVDDSAYLEYKAQSAADAAKAAKPTPANPTATPAPADPNQQKLDAFKLAEQQRQESQALQALGQSFESRPGAGMARPDLGYGPIADRRALTNEQAGVMNPQGRITATRDANGRLSLSGGDVSGQVSYQDADGKALKGGGLRGQFSNFDVAPAGSNLATGPNGSYAFATSGSGLRGGADYPAQGQGQGQGQGQASGGQMLNGVDVSGLNPAQAAQYAREVRQAQATNAASLKLDNQAQGRVFHDYNATDNPGAHTIDRVENGTAYLSNGTTLPSSLVTHQNNGILPHRFAHLDPFADRTTEFDRLYAHKPKGAAQK